MADASQADGGPLPDLAAIRAAHARIAPHVHRTPVLTCRVDRRGSWARGSSSSARTSRRSARSRRAARSTPCSRLPTRRGRARRRHALVGQPRRGARLRGRGSAASPAWVVMPENAPKVKQENVRRFRARRSASARQRSPRARPPVPRSQAETGATLMHPFDDERRHRGAGDGGAGAARGRCRISTS